jgi:hypothetical protein
LASEVTQEGLPAAALVDVYVAGEGLAADLTMQGYSGSSSNRSRSEVVLAWPGALLASEVTQEGLAAAAALVEVMLQVRV